MYDDADDELVQQEAPIARGRGDTAVVWQGEGGWGLGD